MIDQLVSVLVLSLIVEYLVKVVRPAIPIETVGKIPVALLLALSFGVVTAIVTGSNLFEILGFQLSNSLVGQIFTGIIVSGGSGFVHELFEKLRQSRADFKQE